MKTIIAIAVDDEPNALEIIEIHSAKIPFLDLKHSFRDALEAVAWLQSNPCEVIFLDINMPNLSGLKFRELVGEKTAIIFTTAYSEFAVESYELNALDYLVKPVKFERFLKAVLKLKKSNNQSRKLTKRVLQDVENQIFIKSGTKTFKIKIDEILYLEKDGNYILFHTSEKKIMSRLTMEQALQLLPENQFFRVHKSYIISRLQIDYFESASVSVSGIKIPVSPPYREILRKMTQ